MDRSVAAHVPEDRNPGSSSTVPASRHRRDQRRATLAGVLLSAIGATFDADGSSDGEVT